MYTLYGSFTSRAFRVAWMLEEIGQPYDVVVSGPHGAAIMAVNPTGKIPALAVEGKILTDSVAIMTYLGDRHGAMTHPAGTLDRAEQDALTHTLNDEFDSLLWTATRLGRILPEEYLAPQAIPGLKWEFARHLDRLAERMKGPFLQGDEMTHADILATHCLNWAAVAKFPMENEKMRSYAKTMTRRDAYRRARKKMEAAAES